MDAKLTLKLDKKVIDQAKKYAATQKRSLSRLIESYLKSLIVKEDSGSEDEIEISAFVKSIKTGISIPDDITSKDLYGEYLDNKYK